MNAMEQHDTEDLTPAETAEIRERLVDACARAGDAADTARRQALRANLLRSSRCALADVLARTGV